MPNLDRTGPNNQGPMTGRKRGRCRDTESVQNVKTESQSKETNEVIYGVGRGGRPRGGGKGNCYGGGQGQGRGRGRGLGNK
ncbi:MAG: hypothetical protein C0417_06925 [Chlorobiaceae bacterium]|nr:hypothetical protein [Chlorobiaceae bacterium]